ncbi:MAG: CoA transferase subunit A [Anaerolineales bacterium]
MDKLIDLQEGVSLLPEGDAVLALGGITNYRRPMAFSLALLADPNRQAFELLSFTAGLESDILVGANLVSRVRTCYFGLEAFGLAPNFTQASSDGEVEIIEESEASIALGIRAALAGVGFMPSLAWQGTDLMKLRPDVKEVIDPYSGARLTAFPAMQCDLAVIHALKADPMGNAQLGRNWGIDRELAYAAEQVLITAEEIVPRLDTADVDGSVITAVTEASGGAWPTSCHPCYPIDGDEFLHYVEAAGSEAYDLLLEAWTLRVLK